MPGEPRYWFPAKRHGWGWGPPSAWQGWVVLAVFSALVIGGAFVWLPGSGAAPYVLYTLLLCLLLMAVCWWKGEPPRWRRGGR